LRKREKAKEKGSKEKGVRLDALPLRACTRFESHLLLKTTTTSSSPASVE
jgi:hypothetical protein